MPELPEVETIRRELDREVVGKRIKTVAVTGARVTRRHSNKKAFITALEGAKFTAVDRKGTLLVLKLDTEQLLVVDLGDAGQLLRSANKDAVDKGTNVVISFTQHGQLRFVDAGGTSGTGELFVTSAETMDTDVPELAALGIDPVEEPMSWQNFGHLLLRHPLKLRAFLLDSSIIAGIGPLYADEILFAAGLRHDRMSDSLSTQEMRRLYRSLVETLHDAIKYRGTTLDGNDYVDLNGKPGEYQEHLKVYELEKQACRRCRAPIVKAKVAGKATFFCEQCQV
jgi:formamidopyrimidine-DNA glycosylase